MFTACRSMQNIQYLSGSGGPRKYCCKYVGKIDKNNYFTVSTSADGRFIWCASCLKNTKRVTSDKVKQAKLEKKRNCKHPQGTFISVILKYPEVITYLNFIMIQTDLLEKRTGKSLRNIDNPKKKMFTQSDANVTNNYEKWLEAQINWDNRFLQFVIILKVNMQRTKKCSYTIFLAN